MNKYEFVKAEIIDIKAMADIENEYFEQYSRAITADLMMEWYLHNPDMFYVVKNKMNDVLGFSIVNPVSKELYEKLKTGKISDMYDFKKDGVFKVFASDYFYIADICVTNARRKLESLLIANTLISGLINLMYDNAKFVTTSPITKEGLNMCEHIGFKKVAEEIYDGVSYPICELEVTEALYNKLNRKDKRTKR